MKLSSAVIGNSTGPFTYTYSWRDVALYALSVGAGADELQYVYEKDMKAIPSFGVIAYTSTFNVHPPIKRLSTPARQLPYLHNSGILAVEHEIIIHKPICPEKGIWTYSPTITAVYDRGEDKGALIITEEDVVDEYGETVCTNKAGVLYRLDGGFGGEKPPKTDIIYPDAAPDYEEEVTIPLNAALLYRLNGDVFELHADPEYAKQSGFERPILHGLCTFGYACRMAVKYLLPGQPERMRRLAVQFRNPVFPGDTIKMQIWKLTESTAVFKVINVKTDKLVLGNGQFEWV